MSSKRKIEIFSAGCSACDDVVAMVKRIGCSSCDVEVLDMHDPAAAAKRRVTEFVPFQPSRSMAGSPRAAPPMAPTKQV